MVVLQAVPDEGPAYVTVVEAGLLAKFGFNSAGFAVMTNALACTEDQADAGVPYHVMLRALLGCGSTADGLARLAKANLASSANYLLADVTGSIAEVEARPGGAEYLHRAKLDDSGVLLHTNHFTSPEFDGVDYAEHCCLRWPDRLVAIRRPPRVSTTVLPRSASSSNAANERLASVAVIVRTPSDGRWYQL